jgi:hypothetical protein
MDAEDLVVFCEVWRMQTSAPRVSVSNLMVWRTIMDE